MKFSATGLLALLFFLATVIAGIWWYNGGGPDGAGWVTGIVGTLFAILAVASRVLGGAWFTDSAGGH